MSTGRVGTIVLLANPDEAPWASLAPHMTTRKKFLLLAGATLLCGVWIWRATTDEFAAVRGQVAASQSTANETPKGGVGKSRPAEAVVAANAPEALPAATRSEAAQRVKALYRKEQLTRELDLEQRRYGRDYWQSEISGRELAKLQQAREVMLKELTAEANQLLNDLFPKEAGEPIVLTALFDPEHAGPNITFLSPAQRERFEAAILDEGGDAVDRERMLNFALRVLTAGEMDSFRKWNEPSSSSLREQLIGFNQTEVEFIAVRRDAQLTDEERDTPAGAAGLEAQLGPVRFAELLKLRDPAMRTALHDLQRLGLPLAEADWLAAARSRAIADIGEIWQSAALTDAAKRERVAQTERAYSQAISTKFALPEGDLDGLNPGS